MQRKLVEFWVLFAIALSISIALQANRMLGSLPFIALGLYCAANWGLVEAMRAGPTPVDELRESKACRIWLVGAAIVESIGLYALLTKGNIRPAELRFEVLFFAVVAPLFPAILISQVKSFRQLAEKA